MLKGQCLQLKLIQILVVLVELEIVARSIVVYTLFNTVMDTAEIVGTTKATVNLFSLPSSEQTIMEFLAMQDISYAQEILQNVESLSIFS